MRHLKEKILKLRSKGKSYREIEKILKCSKSAISYHCGEGQKIKFRERARKSRRNINVIIRKKIDIFLRCKVDNFRRKGNDQKKVMATFNYNTAYKNIINNPICYLTGRIIDLSMPSTFHLDHIVPSSKGGKNTLKNMGLLSKDVNYAKGNLSIKEFIQLCKNVCEYNGYVVAKKMGA